MRFSHVTFRVKSSPVLLHATIGYHLSLFTSTPMIEQLQENFYVDDWLTGVAMFIEAQAVMLKAGMNLAKWDSNSQVVANVLDRSLNITGPHPEYHKILGSVWITQTDFFSFERIEMPLYVVITKCVVLSYVARLFDPLVFITPLIMTAKCLFHELWQLGLQWDDEVPEAIHHKITH